MAKVIGVTAARRSDQTVYDPTCGSGSLLLKVHDEAPVDITIYGQEMDNATWALARMNMFLHDCPAHEIWKDNTLSSPYFKGKDGKLQTFDFAVANPPFSAKAWTTGFNPHEDEFKRFEYGVPPAKNGDYAFLLHVIKSLKSKGKGAVILPHGVLFRGNKEADIRRNLIKRGLIKGIIGLPANLFYGTGIPACIVVIDKENAHARTGIFMIDASKGFMKDGNKNRLREQDLHKIVDVFNKQIELPRYSRMVPAAEIASPANDNNLNIPRYIDSSEPEDLHDLDAHLNGGIPNRDIDELAAYWDVFPSLRKALFKRGDRSGYSEACVETQQIKGTILAHEEFTAYADRVAGIFEKWRAAHEKLLKGLKKEAKPKQIIHTLSEDLLERFSDIPLLSRYNVYQRLMDYWAKDMQDDVYLIAADGWLEAAKPRGIIEDKEKKIKETPDLVVKRKKYKMDLVPPTLIVTRYFAEDQAAIDEAQAKREAGAAMLEEFIEEHNGEEGLLEDAETDTGKITKARVNARLKEIKDDPEFDDERKALKTCAKLIELESVAGKIVKELQADLDAKVLAKYPKLTEAEIKMLAVDDKWFAALDAAIHGEMDRVGQQLTQRVKELAGRYETPLPQMVSRVERLEAKVNRHLETMGLACN